jgi:hypothetical protein
VLQRNGGEGLPGTVIPVAGIGGIAFLAVQVGVNKGGFTIVNMLYYIMSPTPVSPGIKPHGMQIGRYYCGRRRIGERGNKIFKFHIAKIKRINISWGLKTPEVLIYLT